MTPTVGEIYNMLNAEKATMQSLNGYVVSTDIPGSIQDTDISLAKALKSNSKVAKWRLWLWLMAFASWLVETLFDRHTADIEARLADQRPHQVHWYAAESKKFQYGYAVSWINDRYGYAVDDPAARIIVYAAAREKNGKVIIKVKKANKAPLTGPEMDAFALFWTKWKDAGVKLQFVSQPADQLKITITIIRDRLVLDINNNLLRDPTINPITNAIAAFGESLEFDSIVYLSKLVDCLQLAEGVVDVKLTAASIKPNGGNWSSIDMEAESVAGDIDLSYSLSTFTYIDEVNVQVLNS
jgi:hypothetical protein